MRVRRAGQHRVPGAAAPARLRAAADLTGAVVVLAGLPWGLARLAGSPLSGHWPGWQQVRELGAGPLSDATAVTVLAGAAWLLWAVFAVAVIAEVTAAACGRPVPRLPAIAPVQALAATLAGTIVIIALHLPRTAARAAPPPHAALTVTTAGPAVPGDAASGPGPQRAHRPGSLPDGAGDRPPMAWLDAARAGTSARARPGDCVHTVVAGDSLWELARTYLGSGDRWHQIYLLNRGRPQPGGGTLTDPARIYPGWELLIPAASPHPRHGGGNPPGAGRPARHRATPAPGAAGSPGAARSPHPVPGTPAAGAGAPRHAGPPGVRLPSGALIGLGTAVAVSAAVAVARLGRRRRYRPGTVLTSSLEPAAAPPPVISALDRAARAAATGAPAADGTGPAGPTRTWTTVRQPFPGPREHRGRRCGPGPPRSRSRWPRAPARPARPGTGRHPRRPGDHRRPGRPRRPRPDRPRGASRRPGHPGRPAGPAAARSRRPASPDHHPRPGRRPAPALAAGAAGSPARPRRLGPACTGRGAR